MSLPTSDCPHNWTNTQGSCSDQRTSTLEVEVTAGSPVEDRQADPTIDRDRGHRQGEPEGRIIVKMIAKTFEQALNDRGLFGIINGPQLSEFVLD